MSHADRRTIEATERLERQLGQNAGPHPQRWERMRRTLAERASAEGLVDVALARHDTPLGSLVLGATAAGLLRVGLPVESEEALLEELAARVSPRVLHAPRASLDAARRQLDEYFGRCRRRFDLPLDWRLSAGFRRAVLRVTARIPYGSTASYREVAGRAGRPLAFRAAGSALATNPLPILVPCHRVLPASGGIGAYRGGTPAKELLLALEGAS